MNVSDISTASESIEGWNYDPDYQPVPTDDLPDYMRLKPGVADVYNPKEMPYIKEADIAKKLFKYNFQPYEFPKFYDELPKMAFPWSVVKESSAILNKVWGNYSFDIAAAYGADKPKSIYSSKRKKRLVSARKSRK